MEFDMSYEAILRRVLDRVPSTLDKRESSMIYDALAPACAELAQEALTAQWRLDQCFSDTASREYLIRRARERGIIPREATCAMLKGEFNMEVPIGSRFNIDELNYVVTERIEEVGYFYKVQCETAGIVGNTRMGDMIPIEYISGLTMAKLTELLIPGEDDEDTEVFRERYHASFENKAFGGNKADYIEKVTAIQGVGGCKVHRATNADGEIEGGHVRVVIIDSEWNKPSDELVGVVQTTIDPVVNQGDGDGLAPIGHIVHIEPVKETVIQVGLTIVYEDGYSYEALKSYILNTLDEYFLELNKQWADENGKKLVVRISQIESRILEIYGILDISGTTLNGEEKNCVLDVDSIAVRGDVIG